MAIPQILIVEDEAAVALDIRDKLLRLGYGVAELAFSAEEAVAKAAEKQPDLVLMDITLKGTMDGIAAADHIQKRLQIPVIYLTAHSDVRTMIRAKLTEPSGYVLKPFEENELRIAIEIGLHRHKSVSERLDLDRALIKDLYELALRDPLTHLYNRRHLDAELQREVSRANRKASPFALIMLDVDRFKCINDQFGHAAGDAILRGLANLLLRLFRTEDSICRVGGDEMLLVLTETDLLGAELAAYRLQKEITELHLEHNGQPLKTITVSMGLAVFPVHGSTAEVLYRKADQALYEAKKLGRNQVVTAKTY